MKFSIEKIKLWPNLHSLNCEELNVSFNSVSSQPRQHMKQICKTFDVYPWLNTILPQKLDAHSCANIFGFRMI